MRLHALLIAALVCTSCARSKPEVQKAPRLKDSAPERAAATRHASTPRHQEDDENFWEIEAAKARKLEKEEGPPRSSKDVIPMPPPNGRAYSPEMDAGPREHDGGAANN